MNSEKNKVSQKVRNFIRKIWRNTKEHPQEVKEFGSEDRRK